MFKLKGFIRVRALFHDADKDYYREDDHYINIQNISSINVDKGLIYMNNNNVYDVSDTMDEIVNKIKEAQ